MQAEPDLTLAELAERLHAATGIHASVTTLYRALQQLGLPPKKKTLRASERDTEQVRQARLAFQARLAGCAAERPIIVDESGINIAMTRRCGRAVRGTRVHDAAPKNFGRNVTILGAFRAVVSTP